MCAYSCPNTGSKRLNCHIKNDHILLKIVLLKHNFQDQGLLYANCLFYILTIYSKYFSFHYLSCGICMYIPILTGDQRGCIASEKKGHILIKNVLLKLNILDGSHLYGNCLFYMLTIYHRCLFFQFWGCGIRMHICILKRVQKGHIYS